MKLYSDENFPLRTVFELRKLGHDVLTAADDERANLAISDAMFCVEQPSLNEQ